MMPIILVLSLSPAFTFFIYERSSKYIYASVDQWNNTLVYGNVFFQQEVRLEEITILKKRFFANNTYKIQIGRNKYFVMATGLNLEDLFKRIRN